MGTGKGGKETPQDRYHAKFRKTFILACYSNTEQEIITKLETVPNYSGYIKGLIKEDLSNPKKMTTNDNNGDDKIS
jgi:hypothetical protein